MYLKAKVLNVKVKKNVAFHEKTGHSDPSYFLEATVIDTEIAIPVKYQCSFRDSLGADRLHKAYRDKLPETERDVLAAEVEAEAKQRLENQEVMLLVEDIRSNNTFVTLLVKKI